MSIVNIFKRAYAQVSVALLLGMATSPAFAQGATNIGTLLQTIFNQNANPLYVVATGVFALAGFVLVGFGFWGMYAKGDNPQDWPSKKIAMCFLVGGGLLVVSYITLTLANTAQTSNVTAPTFMNAQ